MSIFDTAISDIFNDKNFIEHCIIESYCYDCICSPITDAIAYTDAGAENSATFTLALKFPLSRRPDIGDKVTFRGEKYRIISIDVDSANASLKLFLAEYNG